MTVPHYINEGKSDMRGIKPGWYAIEDDGNLSSGPFSSHEECVKRINQPTNGTGALHVATRAELKHLIFGHPALRAALGGRTKTALEDKRHERNPC